MCICFSPFLDWHILIRNKGRFIAYTFQKHYYSRNPSMVANRTEGTVMGWTNKKQYWDCRINNPNRFGRWWKLSVWRIPASCLTFRGGRGDNLFMGSVAQLVEQRVNRWIYVNILVTVWRSYTGTGVGGSNPSRPPYYHGFVITNAEPPFLLLRTHCEQVVFGIPLAPSLKVFLRRDFQGGSSHSLSCFKF